MSISDFRAVPGWSALLLAAVASIRCTVKSEGVAPDRGAGGSASLMAMGGSNPTPLAGAPSGASAAGGSGGMSTAGTSAAGATVMEPRGPTPATASAKFPFPQNRHGQFCNYPNYRNSDVTAAYARWKKDTVTGNGANGHQRVQRPKDPTLQPNSTVSEGIGYGMILAVYMNEQSLFDELWKYEQTVLGKNGLMDWYIGSNGTERPTTVGAATDADEDMAWALLMADRQWGGSGTLGDTYLNVAKHQIEIVFNNEIFEYKLLKPGDGWGDNSTVNASYFAPSYYRAFAQVSGNDNWNLVLQTSYETLNNTLNSSNGNTANGLVPAWATSAGQPNPNAYPGSPTNYQYDSCRTPFRIGLDYCLGGEPRARAYVQKTSQFFSAIGAKKIVDGYNLDGSPKPQYGPGQSAAFVGPAVVGAMSDATYSAFIQEGYDNVASLTLLAGGDYYDESWTVLSLLMLTGNFLDYTAQTPFVRTL